MSLATQREIEYLTSALGRQERRPWSMATHHQCRTHVKRAVETLLLLQGDASTQVSRLPIELLFCVFELLGTVGRVAIPPLQTHQPFLMREQWSLVRRGAGRGTRRMRRR